MLKYLLPAAALCLSASAAPLPLAPDAKGFPQGWQKYGKGPGIAAVEKGILRIADRSDVNEWGISRTITVTKPGKYECVVETAGDAASAQLVLNTGKISVCRFHSTPADKYTPHYLGVEITKVPRKVTIYLYGSYTGTPDFTVRSVKFGEVKEFTKRPAQVSAPAASVPAPPVITKLKNLYITTPMNRAVIAPGNSPALRQAAEKLAAKTGAKIVDPATVEVPLKNHVIALGNRANNELIHKLYIRSYCYTDLTYPGRGGYELRSIHNPTGGGFNVILCGGSDDAGAVQAAEMLTKEPVKAGFLLKVKTPGFDKSKIDPADPEHYHLIGTYYGWNYISGVLALFYQTGDTFYAKEFLRLAFPDAKAIRDFKRFNAESIELPNDPLAGPYHYAAHHMILLWDLVEEHPFFTDKQRLDITNAFVRQWKHHVRWTRPANSKSLMASSRHGQWAEISNYALGRYFQKDYPAPAWKDAVERAEACFAASGRDQATIDGEGGIIPWFVSGSINPSAQFFALSGGKPFNPKGGFAAALRFLDTQWDGSATSEVLGTAYRQTFYLTAEHTGDGKYLWYADMLKPYRKGVYKLGATFNPTGKITPRKPVEMMNRWTVAEMPLGKYRHFGLNAPRENCFNGLAWRDTLDTTGDWISFNCFNERYRTPFKLLSIYGLRLNGKKILSGFGNYVQPLQNGAGSKAIPILGQVYNYGNAGNSVFFSGGVPEYGFASWQRDLLLRKRSFVLLADTLKPFSKGPELTMLINFEGSSRMTPDGQTPNRIKIAGESSGQIIPARNMELSANPKCGIFSGARNTHFETTKIGDRAVLTFSVPREITCEPALLLNDNTTRCGSVNIYLDGKKILSGVSHYSAGSDLDPNLVPLGTQYFTPGKHTIEVEVASLNTSSGATNYIGVGSLTLGAKDLKVSELYLTASAGDAVSRSATNAAVKRTVPGDPDRPVTTFSIIREETQPVTAITESDRAAWFLLPEPMLVFCGTRQDIGTGSLVLLEKSGIAGQGITDLGNSLKAAQPVMLDWVFGKSLAVSGKPGTELAVNGKKYTLDAAGNLNLAKVKPADLAKWQTILKNPPRQATAKKEAKVAATRAGTTSLAHLKGNVSFLTENSNGYFAAVDNVLYILDRRFKTLQKLEMSAKILSAVAADGLIAVGAVNDELAAFDKSGRKVWSFTSRLAPEIEATQKYYWFKKPYPGVISLAYRDGRIYAGGACTLEVLDRTGKLIKRYPQSWGPCRKVVFINNDKGGYYSVSLRKNSTDGVYMWTVDSQTGKNTVKFNLNMPGYQHFPSFGSLRRSDIFVADFDGDGKQELIGDAQGMYNWLNCYNNEGNPKYQLNLGPGNFTRTWTVGDITGDKHPEIFVLTTLDQVLAVNGKCVPVWNKDIPFRGASMIAVDEVKGQVWVANQKNLAVFDNAGQLLKNLTITRPVQKIWSRDGEMFALETSGQIIQLNI